MNLWHGHFTLILFKPLILAKYSRVNWFHTLTIKYRKIRKTCTIFSDLDKFGILSVDWPLYTAETQIKTKQPTKTVLSNFISLDNGGNYMYVTLPIRMEIPIEPPCQSNEYIYIYTPSIESTMVNFTKRQNKLTYWDI